MCADLPLCCEPKLGAIFELRPPDPLSQKKTPATMNCVSILTAICIAQLAWQVNAQNMVAEWTWIAGTAVVNQPSVYGPMGVESALSGPGGRALHQIVFSESTNRLILFGGTNPGIERQALVDPVRTSD